MKRVTVADAPAVLNTNDKAFWAIGWNDCAEVAEAAVKQARIDALEEAARVVLDTGPKELPLALVTHGFVFAIESAAAAPLLARIAELERHNKALVERREFDVRDIVESTNKLVELEHRCEALTAQVEQAAQPVAEVSEVCGSGPNDVGIRWRGGIVSPGVKLYTAPPKAVPLTEWTDAQHRRAYINSPELHKDAPTFAGFKRVAKAVAAMYGITPATVEKEGE